MYCINPGCSCQAVIIAFRPVRVKSSTGDEDLGTVAIHLGKWQVEGIDPKKPDDQRKLRSLWERLRERSDLRQTLRERRKNLRAIGSEIARMARREEKETPVSDAKPKPGRNDPCPCGSGRKYKKCCLDKRP